MFKPGLEQSFLIRIGFLFFWIWIWLVVELGFCDQLSTAWRSCFSIFDSQWIQTHRQSEGCNYISFVFSHGYKRSWVDVVRVLIFSVTPSTYSVICPEKYALYLGKFESHIWSPGPLFRLPLIGKRCAGDEFGHSSIFRIL